MPRTDRQKTAIDIVNGVAVEMSKKTITFVRRQELARQLTTVKGWLEEEFPPSVGVWRLPFLDGENYELGQPWGYDPNYDGNTEHFHRGLDFLMPLGTMVCAVADGTVVIAGGGEPQGFPGAADGAWGNYVEIDHGNGTHSGYCHLAGLLAYPGQRVRAGQPLGTVGMTGLTFGPHCHLQALQGGVRVDPTPWLDKLT